MEPSPSLKNNPSWILKWAWRAHRKEQAILKKQKLPTCEGCTLCSLERRQQMLHTKLFKGNVAIHPYNVALDESNAAPILNVWTYRALRRVPRETYWTSGVGPKGAPSGYGMAIVRYSPSESSWISRSSQVQITPNLDMLGVCTIALALRIALKDWRDKRAEERPRSIKIYSDDMVALQTWAGFRDSLEDLRNNPKMTAGQSSILAGLVACEELISFHVLVNLRFVPREGNIMADRAARIAAGRGFDG